MTRNRRWLCATASAVTRRPGSPGGRATTGGSQGTPHEAQRHPERREPALDPGARLRRRHDRCNGPGGPRRGRAKRRRRSHRALRTRRGRLRGAAYPSGSHGCRSRAVVGASAGNAMPQRPGHGYHAVLPPEVRLFAVTGFLGGLTTFSTFSAEVVIAGRPGAVRLGLGRDGASPPGRSRDLAHSQSFAQGV